MKIKIKYLGLVAILLVGAILLSGCIGKKTTEEGVSAPAGEDEETVTQEQEAEGVGKMTDDLYVELMGRNLYEAENNPVAWITEGWANFLKEKGVTEDQFNDYVDKISADPDLYIKLTQRANDRYNELKSGKKQETKKEETTVEKTPVEKHYDSVTAVEPTTKAQPVNEELLPVLKKVFGDEVKLEEDFAGVILTYVANRIITNDDVTAVRTELEAKEYSTGSVSAKQLTMTKPGRTLTISFKVDNQQKAEIEVSF